MDRGITRRKSIGIGAGALAVGMTWPALRGMGAHAAAAPLTAKDHTRIMNAIMGNARELIPFLDTTPPVPPSDAAVLQAALNVTGIDAATKDRIRLALQVLPQVEKGRVSLPTATREVLDEIAAELRGRPVLDQATMARALKSKYGAVPGLAKGLELGARILEDGADSIYATNNTFYASLGLNGAAKRDAVSDIGSSDTIGGAIGGAVGGPGGAVGGAVGASAGCAVAHLFHAIFS